MEEKKLVKTHRHKEATDKAIKHKTKAKSAAAAPPSCSCGKVAEYGCSLCLCCVSCPLSMVWCCVKMPCKMGIRAAQAAKRQIMSSGGSSSSSSSGSCWSAYYSSSFSDIDFSDS
ncbi:hypothetical protein LINPERHAP1_LOCUS35957 [Linum perenne]